MLVTAFEVTDTEIRLSVGCSTTDGKSVREDDSLSICTVCAAKELVLQLLIACTGGVVRVLSVGVAAMARGVSG
jgi:hypothetical protein